MSERPPLPTGPSLPQTDASDEEQHGQMLRRRAEAILKAKKVAQSKEEFQNLSTEETQRILHELCVHHIELEMQNDELRRLQQEMDAERERYFELYDLAPVGYCTLDEQGLIREANLTAATLLGVSRGALVNQPISRFIWKDDADTFYLLQKEVLKSPGAQSRDVRLVKSDGTFFWALMVAIAVHVRNGSSDGTEIRCVLSPGVGRQGVEDEPRRPTSLLESVSRTA